MFKMPFVLEANFSDIIPTQSVERRDHWTNTAKSPYIGSCVLRNTPTWAPTWRFGKTLLLMLISSLSFIVFINHKGRPLGASSLQRWMRNQLCTSANNVITRVLGAAKTLSFCVTWSLLEAFGRAFYKLIPQFGSDLSWPLVSSGGSGRGAGCSGCHM